MASLYSTPDVHGVLWETSSGPSRFDPGYQPHFEILKLAGLEDPAECASGCRSSKSPMF